MWLRRLLRTVLPVETVRCHAVYLVASATLFVTAALAGFAFTAGAAATGTPDWFVVSLGVPVSATALFVHNITIAIAAALGALVFAVPTVLLLAYNGFVIGSMFLLVVAELGFGPAIILLVPHGAIELPALWLAGAVGFRLLHVTLGDRHTTGTHLKQALLGLLVVAGLLYLAALIEVHVTGTIADAMART